MPIDVIQHLRRAVLLRDHAGLTDGQLLGCFVEHRDEDAFASLVRRHGPMVWGVCRRVLAHDADAEDAFQATFLVLVRKAKSVVPREMVGNWLYGVAHQSALQARRNVGRRREKQVAIPERAVADPVSEDDIRPLLDQELSRLPDKYRVVVVLCDLEGKTRKVAARQLGWPEGTVAGRLARAREMLAQRLARRGVALSGMAGLMSAGVPGIVVSSTIRAATHAAGPISASVAVLIQGVLNIMFVTKLKTAAMVLAMLGAATLTCGMLAGKGDGPEKAAAKGEAEKSAKKVAPDSKADALRREREKLEGTWRVVSAEVNGKQLAKGTFEGLVVFDAEGRWKQQTGDGTTLDEGTSELDIVAKPRAIHFTVTGKGEHKGKTIRKLYEFAGKDSVRMSSYSAEKDRPTTFPMPGAGRPLDVFERVKKQPPAGKQKADLLQKERKKFEGAWRVVSMEVNGKKRAGKDDESTIAFDAEGGWKIQKADGSTLSAGTSEIDLVAKPRSIHFTGKSKEETEKATTRRIYEFIDANSLRTSPYLSEEERPKDFSTKGRVLFVWERVQKPELIEGTVKEIDAKSILLSSGERVTLDAKTEYIQQMEIDFKEVKRRDVRKGKHVEIWAKEREGKLVAMQVVMRLHQPLREKEIDDAILERLKTLLLKDADAAKDAAFVRQLYLDILGVLPSPQRVEDFLKDKDADKREKLLLRLTARLAPGRYAGACQVMAITEFGRVSYPDASPSISHIELLADGGLKASFPDKALGSTAVTLKPSGKERRKVWTATVKGDTYQATAIPYSPEAYLFRLEVLTEGKLVAGAQQFYAIREAKAEKK